MPKLHATKAGSLNHLSVFVSVLNGGALIEWRIDRTCL
jgi:hypothetical protein